ncbi:MAG: ABC-2 transporter permease [Candidatus Izemoplasmataceae bacterium]
MNNLLYKELKLSINKFFYLLPLILAALMFIPNWIYTLVFMYFFWITIPQIYGGYIGQKDNSFINMLPVSKKEIVKSKIHAVLILEALHLVTAFLLGLVHNAIYGSYNFFFDINLAFVGIILMMFALFNLVFFTNYFKTGYFFGRPTVYGVVVTLVYAFIVEFSVAKYQGVRDVFEGDFSNQLLVFVVGLIITVLLSWVTIKQSIMHYESIE